MNVVDAAYAVVHDYPGGSASLAPRLGMSVAVLNSKVNPKTTSHHLTLAEADRITGITGDLRIVNSLAATHGALTIPASAECGSDMAVLEVIAGLWERNGALGMAVNQALADDGEVSQCELRKIRTAVLGVYSKLGLLLSRMDAMAQPEAGADA